jgi:hypothetical protein
MKEAACFWLMICSHLLKIVHSGNGEESKITCAGISLECHTTGSQAKCHVDWPVAPLHPITCMIENACITDPKTITLYSDSTLHAAFDGKQLSTESFNEDREHGLLRAPMKFEIKPLSEQPSEGYDPIAGVISGYTKNNNPGHIWGDIIWPVFRMMYAFSAEKVDFQILLRMPNIDFSSKGKGLFKKFVSAVTGRDYVQMNYDRGNSSDFKEKCYKRLFVGSSYLGYSEGNQDARSIWEFRNFLFYRMGFDPSTIPKRTHPTVNILLKQVTAHNSNCKLGNVAEIQEYFAKVYPNVTVITTSWQDMPLLEQIETMQRSDIVISHPGSDVMNAIFMKDRSTLFVPCRLLQGWGIDKSNEVRIWYKIFPYMNVVELCGNEDISYKDGLSTINMEHLPKYMSSVVHDWYIDNGLSPPHAQPDRVSIEFNESQKRYFHLMND